MQIEISQARRATRPPGYHRTWSKTLESLANPLESLRVRLQAALRSVAERASELGVLLVKYSKPGSAQRPTISYRDSSLYQVVTAFAYVRLHY